MRFLECVYATRLLPFQILVISCFLDLAVSSLYSRHLLTSFSGKDGITNAVLNIIQNYNTKDLLYTLLSTSLSNNSQFHDSRTYVSYAVSQENDVNSKCQSLRHSYAHVGAPDSLPISRICVLLARERAAYQLARKVAPPRCRFLTTRPSFYTFVLEGCVLYAVLQ